MIQVIHPAESTVAEHWRLPGNLKFIVKNTWQRPLNLKFIVKNTIVQVAESCQPEWSGAAAAATGVTSPWPFKFPPGRATDYRVSSLKSVGKNGLG